MNLKVDLCSNYKLNDLVEQNANPLINKMYCIGPDQASIKGFWGSKYIQASAYFLINVEMILLLMAIIQKSRFVNLRMKLMMLFRADI